jgi:glutaredoxin 3
VELDLMDNASAIQDALKIVTGGRTVPRVFVGGEFIGGGDDTVEKGQSGELGRLVQAAKGRV